jgi:hypothetical protein
MSKVHLPKYINITQGTDEKPEEYRNIEVPERGLKVDERVIIVNDNKDH